MSARFLLLVSAVVMAVLGGVLIGFGLNPTPVGNLAQNNALVLFLIGAVTGFIAWMFVTFTTLLLCSEILFVKMGNERLDSLNYLLSALLIGNAGDLKIVEKGEVKTFRGRGPFASFSTPGYVIIYHGNAVVFEQYGRPSRVGFKGLIKTKPLETIRAVVELSLQERQKQVTLFTKDGIPLQTEIRVFFQIHAGGHKPTSGDMYPVLEQAVLNAVYAVSDWREYTIETSVAMFRSMVAEHYLHEIYDPLEKLTPEDGKRKKELRVFKDQLQVSLDQETFKWGVKTQNLIIDIKPPKGIEEQALAFERARMEQEIQIENARADNTRIREFMSHTGGTVEDYALLRLSERIAGTGTIPPSLDQLLSDALERANLRASRRQEKRVNQLPQSQKNDVPSP